MPGYRGGAVSLDPAAFSGIIDTSMRDTAA